MCSPQNFIDTLEKFSVVASVALEYVQQNRVVFVRNAIPTEVRKVQTAIGKIRSRTELLEKEFNTLEHSVAQTVHPKRRFEYATKTP
jgi:hypothetical protein